MIPSQPYLELMKRAECRQVFLLCSFQRTNRSCLYQNAFERSYRCMLYGSNSSHDQCNNHLGGWQYHANTCCFCPCWRICCNWGMIIHIGAVELALAFDVGGWGARGGWFCKTHYFQYVNHSQCLWCCSGNTSTHQTMEYIYANCCQPMTQKVIFFVHHHIKSITAKY